MSSKNNKEEFYMKPCPFCGGEGLYDYDDGDYNSHRMPSCFMKMKMKMNTTIERMNLND